MSEEMNKEAEVQEEAVDIPVTDGSEEEAADTAQTAEEETSEEPAQTEETEQSDQEAESQKEPETKTKTSFFGKKKKEKEKGSETLKQLMKSANSDEALQLMRQHTREELSKVLEYAENNFELTVTSFLHENLRGLRRAMGSTKFEKQLIKQMKRTGTVAMCKLDNNTVLEKGLYYYQGNDFASELVYSIARLCEPCLEHIDNNFNPLDAIQKGEFGDVAEDITYLIQQCRKKLENNDYTHFEEDIRRANDLNAQLSHLKREELQRIQSQTGSVRVSMVYLTMVQEAQNVVTYTINLMKVSRKFQLETDV